MLSRVDGVEVPLQGRPVASHRWTGEGAPRSEQRDIVDRCAGQVQKGVEREPCGCSHTLHLAEHRHHVVRRYACSRVVAGTVSIGHCNGAATE